ncbi:hypothetical protein UCDDA912_g00387 [Diaporthe ampelina]|uniref:Uncharacterized protein n=1 Tax=Diaporthe ampelina TaxID=1214573 RepID=A0A0G2FZQ1_9PEZI|nr:hypothetical protein UCDDA912_g00387 [Diaporthe ampelina]
MAVFVDLEDDDVEPLEQGHGLTKPVWNGTAPPDCSVVHGHEQHGNAPPGPDDREEATHEPAVAEAHLMTVALGCYPIVMAVAAQLDLNDLDSLSRTCRGVHDSLLQYRSILLKSTVHCVNEELPVDPESTLRYRARAGNWYYMEDTSRSSCYNGKAGSCARDMVSKCRKCSTIVCRPCGRGIGGADSEYRGIWKWRSQYGEVLGGLGTGIGGNKYIEHETDCDAADAREAEDLLAQGHSAGTSPTTLSLYSGAHSWSSSHSNLSIHSNSSTPGLLDPGSASANTRTPSPSLGPGYARHEVEGIGNKIKSVKITMVRVGGGVPEWEDEKASGQSLRREVNGQARSWCGWCSRVIPSKKDYEVGEKSQGSKDVRPSA